MKFSGFLALCAVIGVPATAAFTVTPATKKAGYAPPLRMSSLSRWDGYLSPEKGGSGFSGDTPMGSSGSVAPNDFELFPTGTFESNWETMQGGGTVRTYALPPWAERCQYTLKTNGRPLKATVNLWIGPIRQVHNCKLDFMDGLEAPYSGVIKFKKLAPVLKITTGKAMEFPIQCSVSIPSPEFSNALAENYSNVWDIANSQQKLTVQGGNTDGSGGGAIRTWNIPDDVDQVQLLGWSRDVGSKSFRAKIEVMRGPNTGRQYLELQCGGSTQPYHGVLQTPGPGWVVRVKNQKFLEDGKIQYALLPYDGNCPAFSAPGAAGGSSGTWWSGR